MFARVLATAWNSHNTQQTDVTFEEKWNDQKRSTTRSFTKMFPVIATESNKIALNGRHYI